MTRSSHVAILTTAVGYDATQMRPLWQSLQQCDFNGRLIMLVDTATADRLEPHAPSFVQFLTFESYTPQLLLQAAAPAIHEALVIHPAPDNPAFMRAAFAHDPLWTTHFFATFNHPSVFRYLFYRDYLQQNTDTTAVILCDARDVIFQRDPSEILSATTPLSFGLEHPSTTLGSEAFNTAWVKHLWGEDVFTQYQGRRISCSGATLGNRAAIVGYLDLLCTQILSHATQTKAGYGFDQAFHNRLWWDNALPALQMTENFYADVINIQGESEATLTGHLRGNRLCRADTGTPIMLVHQYDRSSLLHKTLL